ncbi:SCO3374 family protein [Streptomyces sp. WAC04114]|uniref:SCO3374 family protein n=1 Tax=Streptomyces sp. WAC04114 TaxID=2867961 RepID=UPI001C8C0063|nr:SCO3374 family protein [Streptomyces sp. WAC04114]MBX9363761.1 SCO3374 family protein [Streptomyces sp. WAC04114]
MFGAPQPVTASSTPLVPLPRRPLAPSGASGQVRRWYENELGWPTVPGDPLRLPVGVRYDVLDVPAEAGHAALRRLASGSPVALHGGRMLLLVAAGSAEELPGLLEWLDWGALSLDLVAIGAGGLMEAPSPPVPHGERAVPPARGAHTAAPCEAGVPPAPRGRVGSQGAAVWLRPPEPGCEVEASLPTLSALGGGGDAPDLVRLVNTVATQCHRVRLRRACAQPPAVRAQGR